MLKLLCPLPPPAAPLAPRCLAGKWQRQPDRTTACWYGLPLLLVICFLWFLSRITKKGPIILMECLFHKLCSHPSSELSIFSTAVWACFGWFLSPITKKGPILLMECLFHKLRSHPSSDFGSFSSTGWVCPGWVLSRITKKGPIILMECLFHKLRSHPRFQLPIFWSTVWACLVSFLSHICKKKRTNYWHEMFFLPEIAQSTAFWVGHHVSSGFGLVLDHSFPILQKRDL